MKKNQKNKEDITLYEYDCQLYPRKIWVSVTRNCPSNLSHIQSMDDIGIADTQATFDETTNLGGVLIRFSNKTCMTPSTIAHEAVHAAVIICDYIGGQINLESQEYFAYLVGWIVDCCYDAKKQSENERKRIHKTCKRE